MFKKSWLILLVLGFLLLPAIALAQEGGDYRITSWSLESGGRSDGADYVLAGSVGQVEAGAPLTGGSYRLTGGFWGGAVGPRFEHRIYLPLTLRRE